MKLNFNFESQENHFLTSGISHPGWYLSPRFTVMIYFQIHFSIIIHALYILKIYCQVVGIDFALNHLIKLKYFVTTDSVQANIRRFVL